MKTLLQINPVVRTSTSTGRIMREIGCLALQKGWDSYVAYGRGRDGIAHLPLLSIPVGGTLSTMWHGLQTRLFDRHGLASTRATRKLVRTIEHIKPSVIHIHNIHGYFLNYRVLFDYLSKSGIPVVWTVHDCWLFTGHCYYYSFIGCDKWQSGCVHCPQKKAFPASWIFDRSARNYADKRAAFTSMPKDKFVIVPVSDWMKGEMQSSFLSGYPLRVIHNGVDISVFSPCDTTAVERKYGLEGKRVYLGVASIWSKEKGLDDFIRMAAMLDSDERIVLVGVNLSQMRLLPEQIIGIFRTENVKELAALYSLAGAFVNPTWQDNYPTVNLEAIACGTPVATYRTGGSVEAVTEMTGCIVEQGDVEALLHEARSLCARGKDFNRPVCREYALKHFNKDDRYSDYFDLYKSLTKKN